MNFLRAAVPPGYIGFLIKLSSRLSFALISTKIMQIAAGECVMVALRPLQMWQLTANVVNFGLLFELGYI